MPAVTPGAPAQGNNPARRRPQPGHAQKASMTSQLSQALPMLEVDEMAAPMGAPVITFDHVTKTYPAQPKKPALSDVTLQIFAGEFIFLVGHPDLANPPSSACSPARSSPLRARSTWLTRT